MKTYKDPCKECWSGMALRGLRWRADYVQVEGIIQLSSTEEKFTTWEGRDATMTLKTGETGVNCQQKRTEDLSFIG